MHLQLTSKIYIKLMKYNIITCAIFVFFVSCKNSSETKDSASKAPLIKNGNYSNQVGQNLIIKNLSDSSFDFNITWGENDEWGCIFSEEEMQLLKPIQWLYMI